MKKLTKLLTIGAILLAGIFCTSCGELGNIILDDTANQWYRYVGTDTMEITTTNSTSEMPKLDNIDVYVYYDTSAGLKVTIQKTFDEVKIVGVPMSDIKAGTEKQYEKGNPIGDVAWIAMMGFTNIFEPCSAPEKTNVTLESVVGGEFNWEQFAANMLYERYGNGGNY